MRQVDFIRKEDGLLFFKGMVISMSPCFVILAHRADSVMMVPSGVIMVNVNVSRPYKPKRAVVSSVQRRRNVISFRFGVSKETVFLHTVFLLTKSEMLSNEFFFTVHSTSYVLVEEVSSLILSALILGL